MATKKQTYDKIEKELARRKELETKSSEESPTETKEKPESQLAAK